MNKKLWEPSKILKKNSNLFKFEKFISNKYNKNFSKDFEKIHKWSVINSHNFFPLSFKTGLEKKQTCFYTTNNPEALKERMRNFGIDIDSNIQNNLLNIVPIPKEFEKF